MDQNKEDRNKGHQSNQPFGKPPAWNRYLARVGDRPPTPLAHAALAALRARHAPSREAVILDLGCGNGRDSQLFIDAGYTVVGIDKTREAIDAACSALPEHFRGIVTAIEDSLAQPEWRQPVLVHASFVLPFLMEADFRQVFDAMRGAAGRGALLSYHLLGPRDDWAARDVRVWSREEVKRLNSGLKFHSHDETENDSETVVGALKHWHVHEIVAFDARPMASL
ncbi:MAG: class I SAM-dependent methyltransferase [Alphaproteobacteria bacterium]|nr:class I SAM-dependent methyltransferase [Alphaproteobacteria bacterium]